MYSADVAQVCGLIWSEDWMMNTERGEVILCLLSLPSPDFFLLFLLSKTSGRNLGIACQPILPVIIYQFTLKIKSFPHILYLLPDSQIPNLKRKLKVPTFTTATQTSKEPNFKASMWV